MTELSKYELRDKREVYGNDERAINRHSIRVYTIDGIEFIINKTLDGIPPFYNLYYFSPDNPKCSISKHIKVENQEYWGDGMPWGYAEAKAFKAITEFLNYND